MARGHFGKAPELDGLEHAFPQGCHEFGENLPIFGRSHGAFDEVNWGKPVF